jgi:hypothetical protein
LADLLDHDGPILFGGVRQRLGPNRGMARNHKYNGSGKR